MTTLIILIGVPGCGKSSLAAQLSQEQGCRVISTDAIRAQLFGDEAIQGPWPLIWQEVQRQFQESVQQIHQNQLAAAIYDATNTRRRQRRELIAAARQLGFTQITGIWLDLPLAICLQRNRQRARQVPETVVLRMQRQLAGAPPHPSEGIDWLVRYRGFGSAAAIPTSALYQNSRKIKGAESTGIAPVQRQEPNTATS